MGTISINIKKKFETGIPSDGRVTSNLVVNSPCDNRWDFQAKTMTTAWVEFTIPPNCTISQTVPLAPFTNGIEIDNTQIWEWEFEIFGFVSPSAPINTILTTVEIRIYDFDGGTLLDTATINHYHSNVLC
jgi:hypothetical protein